ncbi:MAG TPA: benzoate-CoA ligase family protein [Pyrinomonadaceae bacterium]|jgi:benzoate-CoA ligase family protein|nr:benzoate-CoA ligase family protein [Pyrinomonadaceae bacterium]
MNLVEYVFGAARELNRWADVALLCEDRRLTYAQLRRAVCKFGGALRSLGVARGERVAIVAADCPEFVASFLGAAAVGALAVPLSTMLSASELEYVLEHCGARLAVVTPEQVAKLRGVRKNLSQLETVLLVGGTPDSGHANEGVLGFDEMVEGADEAEVEPSGDDAPAFILYTSGSTGRPKGALHIQRNLPATVETYCKQVLAVRPGDRLFSSSRLFFAYGLGNSLSFPLSTGAASVLCRERPTPPAVAGVFEKHRPTIFFGVPAVFRALVEYVSQGGTLETRSLRFCVSAGEKLPERIFREWKALTGLDILDGIGSTEMLHMFFSNRRDQVRPGSSGLEVPGYEAKLLDDAGREIEGAGTGALFIKGRSACAGYWMDAEKTADTLRGEWMRTGDIYRRDPEGFYWFEGRGDDLFKVKGLWVSPVEIEEALLSCAEVSESAVVARADADGLNSVVAFVVLKPGQAGGGETMAEKLKVTAERLKAHVSALLPPFKRPAEIRFADALPRTATGKLQRFKLREELADSA